MKRYFLVATKFSLAIVTLIAIAVQFLADSTLADFSAINFFSYFTIQSNFLASFSLLFAALYLVKKITSVKLDLFRGAVVVYMIITGIVYKLLLADLPDTTGTTIAWVNNFLHYILPTVLVIDWLIDPPGQRLKYKDIFVWLIFPLLYMLYSILRGFITGWYPYSFLDPNSGGFIGVAKYILVLGLGLIVLSLATVRVSRFRNNSR